MPAIAETQQKNLLDPGLSPGWLFMVLEWSQPWFR